MARPGHRPGDYSGNPLLLISSNTVFFSAPTTIVASWTPQINLYPSPQTEWILYNNGVIVGRQTGTSFVFTAASPYVLPNLAAIAVPVLCDQDGAYDPLHGDTTAANLTNLISTIMGIPQLGLVLNIGLDLQLQATIDFILNSGMDLILGSN